jgi:hypothetical protein
VLQWVNIKAGWYEAETSATDEARRRAQCEFHDLGAIFGRSIQLL